MLRRFLAPDPASPFEGGGLNRYTYCQGDPTNRVDPTGNISWSWFGRELTQAPATGAAGIGGILQGTSAQRNMADAVASPSIISTMAAAIADAGTVKAGIGSAASRQPHDANDESGWLDVGTEQADGSDAVIKAGVPTGTYLRGIVPADAADDRGAVTVTNHIFGKGKFHIRTYAGMDAVPWRLVTYPGTQARRIEPGFRQIANRNGGVNYAADSRMNHTDIDAVMTTIRDKQDDLPILVLSGAHGRPDGKNYSMGKRRTPEVGLYMADIQRREHWMMLSGRRGNQLRIVDLGSLTDQGFINRTHKRAHIVHASCFGAADRRLMKAHGVRFMEVFSP